MADTRRMKMRGTNVVYRPVGDTSGICCNTKEKKLKQEYPSGDFR